MSTSSVFEGLWQAVHQARSLLTDGGFGEPVPSAPQRGSYLPADLEKRYEGLLAPGAGWPRGSGSSQPLGLILCDAALSEAAEGFVRSWFENPRVNRHLERDFFIQPLPLLGGERPPYAAFCRELCQRLKPKALLSLGAGPAQRLLGAPLSLDVLRGSDYRFDQWSLVTTLDPETFASTPDDARGGFKAQVWRDLQRLLGKLTYG